MIEVLRAYIAEHRLTEPAMARHIGIPYRTLRGILTRGYTPRPDSFAAIERALCRPPPAKKLPAHAEEIARMWPEHSSVAIARNLGISKQRVLQIVRAMGLPPRVGRRNSIRR